MTLLLDHSLAPAMPASPWLQVLGGRAFDLCNPTPDQVDFRTIARVLSRVPRFGGHTERGVLSVAQHCLEGAAAIRRDTGRDDAAAAFLIHDAHEAYIGDIATPVADALAHIASEGAVWRPDIPSKKLKDTIGELKSRLDSAIYTAAGIGYPLEPDVAAIVHEYDRRMCVTERDERLATPPRHWDLQDIPVEGCDLYPWSEGTVFACYSQALRDCGILVDSSDRGE